MQKNEHTAPSADGNVYLVEDQIKTVLPKTYNQEIILNEGDEKRKKTWYNNAASSFAHFCTLFIIGLLIWGTLWCIWGDGWKLNGKWFRISAVAAVAWASGQVLQEVTTLPPLLAALLTGIVARNVGVLDMREYTDIDSFLRQIYPVIILGKGSLAWDINYMKSNWRQVAALGVVPWLAEVTTVAISTHLLLGFPWLWGFLLGSFYASVSCPIIMPFVNKITNKGDCTRNWSQLVCTAGGTDTALSVGVCGIIFTVLFSNTDCAYRYVKAGLTLFVGVGVGAIWGSLSKLVPYSRDYYVTELRVLYVLLGGLFCNVFTLKIGWGGTGGVAVLACNSTAAKYWAQSGWKLNNNPAATAYRVLWTTFEPMLFAYTGTFFVINSSMSNTLLLGLGILLISLVVRLTMAALMCWDMTLREKIFICCAWIPKSIVEAVLCPLALNHLIARGSDNENEIQYAEDLMRLSVQAILITTPVGYLLTTQLGPLLLKEKEKDYEKNTETYKRKSMTGSSQA